MALSQAAKDLIERHGAKEDPRQAEILARFKASQTEAIRDRENARTEALRADITKKLRQKYPQMNRTGFRHLVESEMKKAVFFDPVADFFPNACHGHYGFPFLFQKESEFAIRLRIAIANAAAQNSNKNNFLDSFFQGMTMLLHSYTAQVIQRYGKLVKEHNIAFKMLMTELVSLGFGKVAGKAGGVVTGKIGSLTGGGSSKLPDIVSQNAIDFVLPSGVDAGITLVINEGKDVVYDKYFDNTLDIPIQLKSGITAIDILADYAPGVSQWKGLMDVAYCLWFSAAKADEAKQYKYSKFPMILGNKTRVDSFKQLFQQDLDLLRNNPDKIAPLMYLK